MQAAEGDFRAVHASLLAARYARTRGLHTLTTYQASHSPARASLLSTHPSCGSHLGSEATALCSDGAAEGAALDESFGALLLLRWQVSRTVTVKVDIDVQVAMGAPFA